MRNKEIQTAALIFNNGGFIAFPAETVINNAWQGIFVFETNKSGKLSNLFSSLCTMENNEQIKQIFIEPVIESGLGIAMMGRIRKTVFKI